MSPRSGASRVFTRALFVPMLFGVLWVAGCVTPAGDRDPSGASRDEAYGDARGALDQSRAEGKAALAAFIDANPRDPRAAEAALELSEMYVQDSEYPAAQDMLERLLRRYPYGPQSGEARLLLARVHEALGNLDAAHEVLSGARFSRLPPAEREASLLRLAELAGARGDTFGELRWLSELRRGHDPEALRKTDVLIDDVVRGIPSDALVPLAQQLGRRFPAGRLWLRRAELAIEAGDASTAEDALRRAGALPLSTDEAARMTSLTARLRGGTGADAVVAGLPSIGTARFAPPPEPGRESGQIGVLLPLSGRYAAVGRQCLQGITLAASVFDSLATHRDGGVELVVRDTAGNPERSEAAVAELAAEGVTAVVGPLLGSETRAAARAAEATGLPLLALSRREDVASAGDRIFRFGLTSRAEVEVLVNYVVADLGLQRLGLLYPRDNYGRKVRQMFWDAVERQGGEIVAVAGYEPDATDFADPVRALVGYRLIDQPTRQALAQRDKLLREAKRKPPEAAAELREEAAAVVAPDGSELPPLVDFDALFIPDTHQTVALVAPQLAFHGIKGVRLLGLSDWNHPDLVKIGREHVGGSLFTSAYFSESGHPALAAFQKRYRATFGEDPSAFAAEAFDATRLLIEAMQQGSPGVSVADRLRQVEAMGGVSGVTTVLPDGNAAKRPHLLGVHRGRIISVDEVGAPPFLKPAQRDPNAELLEAP